MTTKTNEGSGSRKGIGGRSKRTYFDTMRTIAWVNDLKEKANKSTNGLRDIVFSINGTMDVRFDKYLNGDATPSIMVLDTLDQHPDLKKSRPVYDVGPEDQGEHVPLWMLFEDRYEEFWDVITDAIPVSASGTSNTHAWRIDQLAHLFVPPEEWKVIMDGGHFQYTPNNPLQKAFEEGHFQPTLRKLAAVVAMWRLSMLVRDGLAPMEYLLHCMLAGPYREKLKGYDIYEHVCLLILSLAEISHSGQWNDDHQPFSGLV